MSFLDLFRIPDINSGVNEFRNTSHAVLLDVRTKNEYRSGHVRGSVNLPLQNIENAKNLISDRDKPVFVYCLSGARSRRAVASLKAMGYTNVRNIGGISSYRGETVKS